MTTMAVSEPMTGVKAGLTRRVGTARSRCPLCNRSSNRPRSIKGRRSSRPNNSGRDRAWDGRRQVYWVDE